MTANHDFIIHTDGAARGNPGPAAYAFTIERPGLPPIEENGLLGATTNNIAEYTALVRALKKARDLGAQRPIVHSDSELMIKQLRGEYKVKNAGLLVLFQEAQNLTRGFQNLTLRHVPREHNKRADQLCNEALDGWPLVSSGTDASVHPTAAPASSTAETPPPLPPKVKKSPRVSREAFQAALAYLEECAHGWSRGDGDDEPEPRAVLERLVKLLLPE